MQHYPVLKKLKFGLSVTSTQLSGPVPTTPQNKTFREKTSNPTILYMIFSEKAGIWPVCNLHPTLWPCPNHAWKQNL